MIRKSVQNLLGIVMLAILATTTIQAQVKTDIYKDRQIKKNSIIVKYDNSVISAKGKTTNPRILAETVKGEIDALVSVSLERQNVEEWSINSDMESTLKKLNSIPGVRAFPNYVFQREDLEAQDFTLPNKYEITSNGESLYPSLETIYGYDLINDGDFAGDTIGGYWTTFIADVEGVSANVDVVDGEVAITDISGADGEFWYIQLNQELTDEQIDALELGTMYKLTFDARSDTTRDLHVFFGENGDDFTFVVADTLTIDEDSATYMIEFLLEEKWDNFGSGMKLGFEGGNSDKPIFIDNVSLNQIIKPLVAAPDAEQDSMYVISLFSDSYDDVPVDTWRTEWSVATFEDDTVDGNAFKSYSDLDFVGIETVANQIDITEMTHVHFDVWTPNADLFRIKLVDFGADGVYSPEVDDTEDEITIEGEFPLGTWVSVDIPLYAFENLTGREKLSQIIFSGVPTGELILFIDNLYFYDDQSVTSDPFLEVQYALNNDGSFNPGFSLPGADVSAFDAWENTTGSDELVVVVYDDGVDFNHEDLASNAWVNPGEDLNGDGEISPDEWNGVDDDGNGYADDFWGWSAVYNDNSFLNDGSFHGTHVAGILGAQGDNTVGISGVAQDVSIISVMIFDEFGSTDAISIMRGYDYISSLLEGGTEIIAVNQSWGGGGLLDYESDVQFVQAMTDFALHHNEFGTLWVISAGNSGGDRDVYPFYSYPNNIQSPNLITVANTNDGEEISGSSDFGLRTVDIGAPGSDILSTLPGGYGFLSGTSMASPQVTGALVLAKSMYPEESGYDLIARILAGTDLLGQYASFFGDGGRLNANAVLDPSFEGFESGLIPSHEIAKFHRTFIDGAGVRTVGFINNTDSDVSITDVMISGTDADNFFVWGDFEAATVPAGGAYGIPVGFDNEGVFGVFTGSVDINTSAGTVSIPLDGLEQTFGDIELSPAFADLGPVPYGTELETSFTLSNFGEGVVNFAIEQSLFLLDPEFSLDMENNDSFGARTNSVEKSKDINRDALIDELTAKVLLERGDRELPKITYSPNMGSRNDLVGEQTVFFDDLNDPDSVDMYWDILNFGEGDDWELTDISDSTEGNYAFLMGDFELGYAPNTSAIAVAPAFDFTELDSEVRPAYLKFDVSTSLEDFYDFFFVNVISNGSRLTTLGGTFNGTVINNGGYYSVYFDISPLAGNDDIEFWFIAQSDEDFAGGFGALFDNVEVITTDAEFFATDYNGSIEPGGSQEIGVGVRTELLPPGDWDLVSFISSDEMISAYGGGAPFHVTSFQSRYVNLALTPKYATVGEVSGDEPFSFDFSAENVGAVGVSYLTQSMVRYNDIRNADFEAMMAGSANAAGERFSESEKAAVTERFDPMSHKRVIMEKWNAADVSGASNNNGSTSPRITPSLNALDIYSEGFETGTFDDEWFVEDGSFGLGSTFDVSNLGTEESPFNVLLAGDVDTGVMFDNTYTLAYSPVFSLSEVPVSDDIMLEFTYSFLMEPGYDVGSAWIGVITEFGLEAYYLGSTEDAFLNNGNLYRTTMDITQFKGAEAVVLMYLAETDEGVQSAWALIDDIDIYTAESLTYVTPAEGFIDSAGVQDFNVTVNAQWLNPGSYSVVSYIDYFSEETFTGRGDFQSTDFSIENLAPIAVADTLAILAGDVVPFDELLWYHILSNDYDEYGQVYLYDYSDPIYGSIKTISKGEQVYVAPLNYDGYDYMRYIITDGEKMDTSWVHISVHAQPEFIKGSDQQYVFLEDHDLTLTTTGMAAGVGGQDPDLMVWASSNHEDVFIEHDGSNHSMHLSATENFYGQTSAEFYVGYPGEAPLDSMTVSLVVIPVNDAPTADFTVEVEGQSISFMDISNDALDMSSGGIIKWEWNFGDGSTSEERNPSYTYSEPGDYTVTLKVTDNGGLFASTMQQIPVTVSNENLNGVPKEFAMEQNYPNPFNPSTIITYSVPEASKVSILVYDMLGQKVSELVNAQKAVGNYTVSFNAAGLSSGVYIYQIRAGKFSQTKKMLLIK